MKYLYRKNLYKRTLISDEHALIAFSPLIFVVHYIVSTNHELMACVSQTYFTL